MFYNELIFLCHLTVLCFSTFIALRIGAPALIGLMCVEAIIMNLFVLKQIHLFGLEVTATDAFSVGIALALNLLQEYYGRTMAQKAIWISFFTAFVVVILSIIHLAYIPSRADLYHPHFTALLTVMPRIVIASLTTYVVVLSADALVYGWFKKITAGHFIIARNYLSLSVSQLLDTVLFSFLGLYGLASSLTNVIMVSYTIKLITIAYITPLVALINKYRINRSLIEL
jgi:uncharacterized integral membrane protein (TIGR00697 family)